MEAPAIVDGFGEGLSASELRLRDSLRKNTGDESPQQVFVGISFALFGIPLAFCWHFVGLCGVINGLNRLINCINRLWRILLGKLMASSF